MSENEQLDKLGHMLADATIPNADPRPWTELAEAIERGECPAMSELKSALVKYLPAGMGQYVIKRLTELPRGGQRKDPRVEVPKKTNEAHTLAFEVLREHVLLRRKGGTRGARTQAEDLVAARHNMTGNTLRSKIADGRKEMKRCGFDAWPTLTSLRSSLKGLSPAEKVQMEDIILGFVIPPEYQKALDDAGISAEHGVIQILRKT